MVREQVILFLPKRAYEGAREALSLATISGSRVTRETAPEAPGFSRGEEGAATLNLSFNRRILLP